MSKKQNTQSFSMCVNAFQRLFTWMTFRKKDAKIRIHCDINTLNPQMFEVKCQNMRAVSIFFLLFHSHSWTVYIINWLETDCEHRLSLFTKQSNWFIGIKMLCNFTEHTKKAMSSSLFSVAPTQIRTYKMVCELHLSMVAFLKYSTPYNTKHLNRIIHSFTVTWFGLILWAFSAINFNTAFVPQNNLNCSIEIVCISFAILRPHHELCCV